MKKARYSLLFALILSFSFCYFSSGIANERQIIKVLQLNKSQPKDFVLVNPKRGKLGMFATFNLVLGHLYLYEAGGYPNIAGLEIDFGEKGNYYDPLKGPNWWSYFFEPLVVGSKKNAKIRFSSNSENLEAWEARRHLNREVANRLIHQYVKVRQPILDKVDLFIKEKFGEEFVIGVHYRGTDKSIEAPRVPYEDVHEAIDNKIAKLTKKNKFKLFIATDEKDFLDYMESSYPGKVIAIEAFRSENGSPVHHSENDPYQLGEQALMDALLLSKCHFLLRTSSSLSLWSTYYNIDLPFEMLSHRYNNKPE